MNILITDNMLKEAHTHKKPALILFVIAVAQIIANWVFKADTFTSKDILLTVLSFFFLVSWMVYAWLYAVKYTLTITETQISVITLFKRHQMDIREITQYTYKRYLKTEFYQFKLFAKNRGLMISTRYRDDLIALLNKNNIPEKR